MRWNSKTARDTNTNNNQMRETPRSPQGPNEKGRESIRRSALLVFNYFSHSFQRGVS